MTMDQQFYQVSVDDHDYLFDDKLEACQFAWQFKNQAPVIALVHISAHGQVTGHWKIFQLPDDHGTLHQFITNFTTHQ